MHRMTARSVVLSVLLGAHPAWASARELIQLTADFGIKETALRVAVTRLVSAGDLIRSADGYRLSDRLLARQRRQDDALAPRVRDWDGTWSTVIVTSVGVDARTRALLRKSLQEYRFGELREGVWLRPDNIVSEVDTDALAHARVLNCRDDHPTELAHQLWDLSTWSDTGNRLLHEMAGAADVPGRFVAAAATVRHVLTDPVLPEELLPTGWPGAALRRSYATFAAELAALRDTDQVTHTNQLTEAT
ncbi:MAG: PaaX family transcriptional regulator C-terminal domain-containing protein [Mycobacterium sp.]